MKALKLAKSPYTSLAINTAYALGNCLIALSICIVGVNIMSAVKDRGTAFHEIIMIAIATYTFTKIEDKFVDAYLTKDGETVEEAKARLKKENK